MADNEKLGSTSPEVLLKNATNLDELVNGRESESLPDRFAVLRRTWYGMEMAFNRLTVSGARQRSRLPINLLLFPSLSCEVTQRDRCSRNSSRQFLEIAPNVSWQTW